MRALALLFSSTLVGCILFVSPEEYGTTCRFEGEDSQCGSCVAAKCRADVDECCRDKGCDPVMALLDDCTRSHGASCASLKSGDTALSACIARECGLVCDELRGAATTKCREPRLGEGSACTCEANGEVNDFVCSAQVFTETLCCAPEGWPSPGLACTCRPLNCNPNDEGCFCSLGDFTPKQRECSAVKCCAEGDTCTCSARACAVAFQTEVPSCSVAALKCGKGQIQVPSCSGRTP